MLAHSFRLIEIRFEKDSTFKYPKELIRGKTTNTKAKLFNTHHHSEENITQETSSIELQCQYDWLWTLQTGFERLCETLRAQTNRKRKPYVPSSEVPIGYEMIHRNSKKQTGYTYDTGKHRKHHPKLPIPVPGTYFGLTLGILESSYFGPGTGSLFPTHSLNTVFFPKYPFFPLNEL